MDIEVFRLWYEYLKRADSIWWTDRVRSDFGDVSGSFEGWWPTHQHLFTPMERQYVEPITTPEKFDEYEGDPDFWIVAINLLEPRRSLIKEFNTMLRKAHPGRKGRPKFEDFRDHYELERRPNVARLKRTLDIYDAYKAGQKAGLRVWEIGQQLDISPTYRLGRDDPPKIASHKKKVLTSLVGRQIRKASSIINNAACGRFPVDD